jgi:hypothetical protein
MIKVQVRATLLALFLPLFLSATPILKNDILKIEATKLIIEMGDELALKTGVHAYVIATNERFDVGYNLVEYSKKYEQNMSKPYVIFVFAPFATITKNSEVRGRVGIIPSSSEIRKLYDYDAVRDSAVDVVAAKDKNTDEDKHNVGTIQAFSELCDNIAESKGVKLTKTIPNETRYIVFGLKILVYIGSLFVFWIFMFRPLYMRIKNGKQA